jgi:hypothetical protein
MTADQLYDEQIKYLSYAERLRLAARIIEEAVIQSPETVPTPETAAPEAAAELQPSAAQPQPWPDWVQVSPAKIRAIRELRARGYAVSDGSEYGLQQHLDPSVTLEAVREALSKIEGSLSDYIIASRADRV